MASNKNVDVVELAAEVNMLVSGKIGAVKIKEIINALNQVINDTLVQGKKVSMNKLGTFDTKILPGKTYISSLPTIKGQEVVREPRYVPTFKFSKYVKEKLKDKKVYYHDGD